MAAGWRLQDARHAAHAFSGEGARRSRGRWNSRGTAMVYLSQHQSLTVLEVFVRRRPFLPGPGFVLIGASWDEKLMKALSPSELPADWRSLPQGLATAAIGDAWAKEARSAVLAVPSAIVPAETNYLINPAHPDFRRIKIGKPEPFGFDPRLLQR
ncbi:MAG TPA: RES family NAD+ phosphorylase [Chthoniobacterales bacterium]|jgi:RES domain-containing protein